MAGITNTARLNEEKIELARACIEHRATWMALTYEEMEKAGHDAEKITRAAVKRCGLIHGARIKARVEDPDNVAVFTDAFLTQDGRKIFEMNIDSVDGSHLDVQFNFCPLVSAWQKLGLDEERIAKLCDIAMDGDRGIAEAMGLKFELGDTIATRCATCQIHFRA